MKLRRERNTLGGHGTVTIEGIQIGANINRLEKRDSEEEGLWHNYNDVELYLEKSEIDAENTLYVLYLYYLENERLDICYGINKDYSKKYVIENFYNGDYGINIPRHHSLVGSLNAEIEEEKHVDLEKESNDVISLESTGGNRIKIEEKILGEEIKEIGFIEDYRGEEVRKFKGKYGVKYEYFQNNSLLKIYYGDIIGRSTRYGNEIHIKDFVNGDYGIKLPMNTPVLWGSRYKARGSEDIKYEMGAFLPKGGYKDSNGGGKIVLKNKAIGTDALTLVEDYEDNKKVTDNVYRDNLGNIIIHDVIARKLIIKPKVEEGRELPLEKIIVEDYVDGDYKINVKNPVNTISGSRVEEIYTSGNNENIKDISREIYGREDNWKSLLKENGRGFGEEEGKKLKSGQKVYVRRKNSVAFDFSEEFSFAGDLNEVEAPFGNGKLKIKGKYIGKNINLIDARNNIYYDENENTYIKTGKYLFIKYKVGKDVKNLLIDNYNEGDYGIWLEESAPYYYLNGKVIRRFPRKEMEEGELQGLGHEQNDYLWNEVRIKDDYLWISTRDRISMYKTPEEAEENRVEEERTGAVAAGEAASTNEEAAVREESQSENEQEENSYTLEVSTFEAMDDLRVSTPTGGGSLIVVQGAQCMCSGGTAPGTLSVMSNQIMTVEGKLVATIKDSKVPNITPMGSCLPRAGKSIPPCSLAPGGDWICPDGGFDINGSKVLTVNGKLMCQNGGGTITIKNAGQQTHKTKP